MARRYAPARHSPRADFPCHECLRGMLRRQPRSGGLGCGAAGDARATAVAERLDEGALGGRRLPSVRPEQVDGAAHALRAFDAELDELAALEFVGYHEPRHEADPETGLDRALDRLVRVELPPLRGPVADPSQLTVGDGTRAGPAVPHEQRLAPEVVEADHPPADPQAAGRRDAAELVVEEGLRRDALGQV